MWQPIKRFVGAALALGLAALWSMAAADQPVQKARPEVEVVFVLDTTGSMGGLIDAAKQKIWTICNQIAGGKPTPFLKVGLVAYRDRGDQYVTKVFDLTDDLDAIHGHLMQFRADGGGDFPESVNQALHEAVTKIQWSNNKKTLKMIFLVGDASPQMNYKDDIKYPETCKLALTKDIIINTVQCGSHPETQKYWQEICRLAEGSYVQIDAKGGPVVVYTTPFDTELAKINAELCRTTLCWGNLEVRAAGEAKKDAAAKLSAPAAAERAGYSAKNAMAASYDLLDSIKNGKVKLEEIKKDELPEELQKMTLQEQREHLSRLEKKRTELLQQAGELDKKRNAYIVQKQAEDLKNRPNDSFDSQVLRILQRQAARNNIQYSIDEKK